MNSLPRKWKKRICQTGFLPVAIRVRVGLKPSATYTDRACPSYHPPPSFLPVSYDSLLVGERGGDTTRVESLSQEHNTVTSLGIDSRLLILPSSAQWQSRYLFRILDRISFQRWCSKWAYFHSQVLLYWFRPSKSGDFHQRSNAC